MPTPCRDCTLTHPREATHGLRFDGHSASWGIAKGGQIGQARILYCAWHATVRATQLNAEIRRPRAAAVKGA
jgi:hypothetical protein